MRISVTGGQFRHKLVQLFELLYTHETCCLKSCVQVLSNAQKRQVYDIYGKPGLKAGLDVGTKLKSVDELKAQWEKFRAQQVCAQLYHVDCLIVHLHMGPSSAAEFQSDPYLKWAISSQKLTLY